MSYRQSTLKDIAKELNTSITTVSRALKGHYSISEKMRQRVNELAKEKNYHPNPMAVSLLKSRSHTMGVIIPEIGHNFYAMTMEGIEDVANTAGYNVMFCVSKESMEREKIVLNTLLNNRVDGLLIAPTKETTDYKHIETLVNKGIPIVLFDRHFEDLPVSKVIIDDYEGAYNAVNHLVHMGCKRIAHIAGPTTLCNAGERLNGYVQALKQHGLPVEEELIVRCDLTKASAIDCATRLLDLKNKPDAIFFYGSYMAFEGMLVAKQRGLRIPQDIAFVGFATEPLISYMEPQLTSIIQPTYQLGQEAAKLFLKQMNAKPGEFVPETVILETKLDVRGSSKRR